MTYVELSQNIKSQTGLDNGLHLWRGTIQCLGQTEEPQDRETDNLSNPVFMAYYKDDSGDWKREGNIFSAIDAETHIVFFNPYGLPGGLLRWLITKPESETTRNLLFSQYGWRNIEFSSLKDLHEVISSDPKKYLKLEYNFIGQPPVKLGRNTSRRTEQTATFDVDINRTESGHAEYWIEVDYDSVILMQSQINSIRATYHEEGRDDALSLLEEFVLEGIENMDAHYGDCEYERTDHVDTQLNSDDTNYESILEEIIEA